MRDLNKYNMITLLGPTAVGKTRLAARLAIEIKGQIISADSRQVYRGMDLGTGKDIADYKVNGSDVPFHLIDIVDPGYEYSVYEFVRDFKSSYNFITEVRSMPILCGGTGLYIDAVLSGYRLSEAKPDQAFRASLELKSDNELIEMLANLRNLHNSTDTEDRKRLIRAIEIARLEPDTPVGTLTSKINSLVFGLRFDREILRQRITMRLKQRLDMGMADEVRQLIAGGISPEKLMFYGLEYKYLTLLVTGRMKFDEMFSQLNTSIHQFAKRQMTWFRRMERNGIQINWLEGEDDEDRNLALMLDICKNSGIK
jgi:tRNA dimethylallyltransferase